MIEVGDFDLLMADEEVICAHNSHDWSEEDGKGV